MHEIPPLAEQLLRQQGVTDAEFDELRRTGMLRRADSSGATIDIRIDEMGNATMHQHASAISVDGISLNGESIQPEALARLRQFHRFMPDHVVQNIELATGVDIDGDGQVGGGGSNPAPPAYGTSRATRAAAATPNTADGPFVQRNSRAKVGALALLAVVIVVAAVVVLAAR